MVRWCFLNIIKQNFLIEVHCEGFVCCLRSFWRLKLCRYYKVQAQLYLQKKNAGMSPI